MDKTDEASTASGYQLFMLALCIYALAVLGAQAVMDLQPETRTILDYADFAVCGLFFVDFVVSFVRAPLRWHYLATWGWIDLLSSIPTLDFARWGRLARVLRSLRVLRGLRATKLLAVLVLRRRAENTFLTVSLLALLLLVFCSVGVLQFEKAADGNIKSPEDAVWWAFATITTVGYGDHYPVTLEGRFLAAILMCSGVGLFGTFSGLLAAWFLNPGDEPREAELKELREELARLRALLETRLPGGPDRLPPS